MARRLLRFVARWFQMQNIRRVCVNADIESAGAVEFYTAQGAVPLNRYWYMWEDVGVLLERDD